MNTKNILLTGARAPVTLHLSRLLHAATHQVIIAESFPYHLCKYSKSIKKSYHVPKPKQQTKEYIDELKKIIVEENIDLLIPTCEEIFYISKYKYELTPYCEVFVEDFEIMKMLHHKYEFLERVKQCNLLTPNTYMVTSKEEMAVAMELYNKKVVLKPVYSRFGSKTVIVDSNSVQVVYDLTVTPESPWVVQEYITGSQYCSYSIVREGKMIAHSVYETNFSASGGATIAFAHISQQEILNWVSSFVKEINYTGQIAFDFIIDSKGNIYPIECNPRSTSGLHLFTKDDLIGIFTDEAQVMISPKSTTKTMITLAMLLYGKKNLNWVKTFLTSKDVLFSWGDVKPYFYQFYSFYQFQKLSKKENIDILESTTFDIEWNGEE